MKFRLLLNLLFCSSVCLAQNDLPSVYEIRSDTAVDRIPEMYWQMLVDTSGKLTVEDISSPEFSNRFFPSNIHKTGFGYGGIHDYWQRVHLKNLTGRQVRLVFRNVQNLDRIDLYIIRSNGKTEHQVAGTMIPFSQRSGYKRDNALPVELASDEEITVLRKSHVRFSGSRKELYIGFTFFDPFVIEGHINDPWFIGDVRNWLIGGILLFGFFFNLFFFLIDRDRIYLYMSLLLGIEGLWYLTTNRTITFRESPYLREYVETLISHCAFFTFVTLFVRKLLKTSRYYPWWDKLLITLLVLMLISANIRSFLFTEFITIKLDRFAHMTVAVIFFALMFSLLLSFLFFRKEKGRLENLSVLAALPAFLYWSIGYLYLRIVQSSAYWNNTTPTGFAEWLIRNELVVEMFCVAWFAIFFTWIMLQRYSFLRKQFAQQALEREREKTELMNQQKEMLERKVTERTAELQSSLQELKSTQAQLIHSEKMASLGELTAGIAHEIQNPLNFVNNFSEVNKELTGELDDALSRGNWDEARQIAKNISENQEKITHHGRRADSIVKGMLQHSRSSSGVKEPTDINSLADEYLRLAYHGLRAKDKSFNATMKTDLDSSLPPVNVVSQDIGRVILNLITNAFYAVAQRQKSTVKEYEPLVTVATRNIGGSVEIIVTDNGKGIPQHVRDKIFQPFFTTKPAGEGTGLGLSLSYDIVKAHGGELKVKSEEGEGTEFIIHLPLEK